MSIFNINSIHIYYKAFVVQYLFQFVLNRKQCYYFYTFTCNLQLILVKSYKQLAYHTSQKFGEIIIFIYVCIYVSNLFNYFLKRVYTIELSQIKYFFSSGFRISILSVDIQKKLLNKYYLSIKLKNVRNLNDYKYIVSLIIILICS